MVTNLTPLLEEHARFWGGLPFKKYVFLNIVSGGGGSGVEHLNSVAITTGGTEPATSEARCRNAAFLTADGQELAATPVRSSTRPCLMLRAWT